MRWLEQHEQGFPTGAGPVPIVVGAALYDLAVGDAAVRPGPREGELACAAAVDGPFERGEVGAGTGATVGKWRGPQHRRPAGLDTFTARHGDLVVSALVALNAFGDVDPAPQGLDAAAPDLVESMAAFDEAIAAGFGNTTLAVVATNARLDKAGCLVVAQGGHDGLARSLFPPHTRVDGDAVIAAATGQVDAGIDVVRALAVLAVEGAVRRAGSLR
jgi:L-aminopeptidase/D-esterase-like protein